MSTSSQKVNTDNDPNWFLGYPAVPLYLMAGWLYESEGANLITDVEWDQLCAHLDMFWDYIEHRHKHLIDPNALSSATAAYLPTVGLPSIVHGAAKAALAEKLQNELL